MIDFNDVTVEESRVQCIWSVQLDPQTGRRVADGLLRMTLEVVGAAAFSKGSNHQVSVWQDTPKAWAPSNKSSLLPHVQARYHTRRRQPPEPIVTQTLTLGTELKQLFPPSFRLLFPTKDAVPPLAVDFVFDNASVVIASDGHIAVVAEGQFVPCAGLSAASAAGLEDSRKLDAATLVEAVNAWRVSSRDNRRRLAPASWPEATPELVLGAQSNATELHELLTRLRAMGQDGRGQVADDACPSNKTGEKRSKPGIWFPDLVSTLVGPLIALESSFADALDEPFHLVAARVTKTALSDSRAQDELLSRLSLGYGRDYAVGTPEDADVTVARPLEDRLFAVSPLGGACVILQGVAPTAFERSFVRERWTKSYTVLALLALHQRDGLRKLLKDAARLLAPGDVEGRSPTVRTPTVRKSGAAKREVALRRSQRRKINVLRARILEFHLHTHLIEASNLPNYRALYSGLHSRLRIGSLFGELHSEVAELDAWLSREAEELESILRYRLRRVLTVVAALVAGLGLVFSVWEVFPPFDEARVLNVLAFLVPIATAAVGGVGLGWWYLRATRQDDVAMLNDASGDEPPSDARG